MAGYTIDGDDTNTTIGIDTNNYDNFTITDGTIQDFTTYGIQVTATTGSVTAGAITDVRTTSNILSGQYVKGNTAQTVTGLVYTSCVSDTNGKHGFDSFGAMRGITYSRCTAYANGKTSAAHGFSAHAVRKNENEEDNSWTEDPVDSDEWSLTLLNAADVVTKVVNTTDTTSLFEGSAAGSLDDNEWVQDGQKLYIQLGTGVDPNDKDMRYTRCECSGIVWANCTAYLNEETGSAEGHGFCFDNGSSGTAYGNISYDNEGGGFSFNDAYNSATYRNNIAFNNGGQGVSVGNYSNDIYIYNNDLYSNDSHGIGLTAVFSNVTAANNICMENGGYELSAAAAWTTTYNCTYNNSAGLGDKSGNVTHATGAVTTDPKFMKPGAGTWWGFRLRGGSPAINAGADLSGTFTTDYKGYKRPVGSAFDIGALEWALIRSLVR